MKYAFLASKDKEAQAAAKNFRAAFGKTSPQKADVIIVLGGDGFMLQSMHDYISKGYNAKIYGMNMGTVGFLLNKLSPISKLEKKIRAASTTHLHPLKMVATTQNNRKKHLLAINEVSLLRQVSQTSHIRIVIDGRVRLETLYADGVLLATAAGSTAYNFSVGGPIVPIGSSLLALTPISAFRPRRWRGGLLPSSAHVRFEVLDAKKRPVSATADHEEIRNVLAVDIVEDKTTTLPILFDKGHELEERIVLEQFQT